MLAHERDARGQSGGWVIDSQSVKTTEVRGPHGHEARRCYSPPCATHSLGCVSSSPTPPMPVASSDGYWPNSGVGRSRLSAAPTPYRASSPSRADGSSSASSLGSTQLLPCQELRSHPRKRAGFAFHTMSNFSRDASPEIQPDKIISQALRLFA